jgi:flagellar hook-associated protein 1 FlgK
MLRSTFLGYKTATSALKVNQNMMDVVGQNISNINTEGYTRQRLDINSVSFSTRNIKLGTTGVIIGQGVNATGVSQFRDSFLDLRYRMSAAKTGSEDVQLEALSDLELIMDEISKDGLDAQFSDLLGQLHSLTSSPSDPVLEGVVRTSAQMLTQMFNDYSKQLSTIRNQQLSYLENGAIVKINQLNDNIAKLNQQIKEDNISGNPALELNDERNMLIDELSSYLDIEVVLTPVDIGGGRSIDELSIKLRDVNPSVELVNNNQSVELGLIDDGKDVDIFIRTRLDGTENNSPVAADYMTQKLDKGQIGGYIKFLNGKGEYATTADPSSEAATKGVQYYQNMLDTLANKFASVMNEVNKIPTANSYNIDGEPIYIDGKLKDATNKNLFEARNGGDITAGNIKISDAWADSTSSYITNTVIKSSGDTTGATDNILKMISKFKSKETFKTIENLTGKELFKGTFQEFLSFTTTSLNLQVADAQTSYDTYYESQYQIDFARSSMSSVDLNEEGVNLLQYSKSYNAAARLMTTLDEMLDTLINRMGV